MENKFEDNAGIRGEFDIVHLRGGQEIARYTKRNLITSAGKAGLASVCGGDGGEAVFKYLAIGTATAAAAAGDTALGAEITTGGGERAAATVSRVTTTVTNDTSQLVKTFAFTAAFAVTEMGALNDPTAGTLLAHQVFSAINVVSGDSLQITHKTIFA